MGSRILDSGKKKKSMAIGTGLHSSMIYEATQASARPSLTPFLSDKQHGKCLFVCFAPLTAAADAAGGST